VFRAHAAGGEHVRALHRQFVGYAIRNLRHGPRAHATPDGVEIRSAGQRRGCLHDRIIRTRTRHEPFHHPNRADLLRHEGPHQRPF